MPDDLETIAKEVREFSEKYTHVITSGGIGPTHDDLTFQGILSGYCLDSKTPCQGNSREYREYGDLYIHLAHLFSSIKADPALL